MRMLFARATTTLLAASARCSMRGGLPRALVTISDAFDAGNVELDPSSDADPSKVRVRIKPDPYTELEEKSHMQWFAFRATHDASSSAEEKVTYEISNAGECSFAVAWRGAEVVASHDKETWRRVPSTRYDEERGVLSWDWHHAIGDPASVYFAYFDLYSYESHLALVARCAATTGAPGLAVRSLGQTLDGRELDCIRVGTGPLQAWIIHRQHPGESMAEFFAEGLLTRLLGLSSGGQVDALTAK